jgi:septal ring factor EnvC (AmiA/AmiB activator)
LATAELVATLSLNGQTIIGAVSVILSGGFFTTVIAVWKAKPERDAVVVMPWQNLTTSLGDHIKSLQADWQRERDARVQADQAREQAERQTDVLEDEVVKLEASVRKLKRELEDMRLALESARSRPNRGGRRPPPRRPPGPGGS